MKKESWLHVLIFFATIATIVGLAFAMALVHPRIQGNDDVYLYVCFDGKKTGPNINNFDEAVTSLVFLPRHGTEERERIHREMLSSALTRLNIPKEDFYYFRIPLGASNAAKEFRYWKMGR